jgi:hypothetical protein
MTPTEKEVARMVAVGCKLITLRQYILDIQAMGFRLDRTMDARRIARDMDTGECFPAITSGARQIETGAGFANILANRDCEGWKAFMEYRKSHFCIVRDHIFTV